MNVQIAEDVYGKLFYIPDKFMKDIDCIMINLNSLLSPVFYDTVEEEVNSEKKLFILANSIIDIFKAQMIERYSSKKVIFYYKDIYKEHILRNLYPEWRIVDGKSESNSVGRKIYDIIDDALMNLEKMGQIQVLKTSTEEHTYLPRIKVANAKMKGNIIIISRDPMDLPNAIYKNISIWNGRHCYSMENIRLIKPLEFTNITPVGVPWALLIAGAPKKIGYKGIHGYGIIKAMKYISANLQLISSPDEEILEDETIVQEIKDILKYKPLFIYSEYLKYIDSLKNSKGD